MKNALILTGLLLISGFYACKSNKTKSNSSSKDVIAANMDTTIVPGNDFYMYANGKWIKDHPIPASESSWSIGHEVQESIYDKLLNICISAAKEVNNSDQKKVGDLFATGMDSLAIEKNALQPLAGIIASINKISSVKDAVKLSVEFNKIGLGCFFEQYIAQDSKKSDVMACYLYQGGLGLPNRDYYFNKDERTKKIREQYPAHIAKMLILTGQDEKTAKTNADNIIKFETALASKSRKLEDLRDPYANYNKMQVGTVTTKLTPQIDWKNWYAEIGIKSIDSVIVGNLNFILIWIYF